MQNFGGEKLLRAKDFTLFPRVMFYVEHLPVGLFIGFKAIKPLFPTEVQ